MGSKINIIKKGMIGNVEELLRGRRNTVISRTFFVVGVIFALYTDGLISAISFGIAAMLLILSIYMDSEARAVIDFVEIYEDKINITFKNKVKSIGGSKKKSFNISDIKVYYVSQANEVVITTNVVSRMICDIPLSKENVGDMMQAFRQNQIEVKVLKNGIGIK